MRLSLNWIRDFIDLSSPLGEIAERLSLGGLEVESLHPPHPSLREVLVASILSIEPHPNAERLSLCEVRAGAKQVRVVCGAKNMAVGDKVPLALPGLSLPNGLSLKESEIRGVRSSGMLCSASELGFLAESSGLMILPPELSDGLSLEAAYPEFADTLLTLNVTPNRSDCLSHYGVARELSALLKAHLRPLKSAALATEGPAPTIENRAPERCPRYAARLIHGVQVKASPLQIQRRLQACGLTPINNIVDATNYVLLELGQPLHAFDLDRLAGPEIQVRLAEPGEKLKTLDGVERSLQAQDLVIADARSALALAGIMGGADSAISAQTRNILLESAYFSPLGLRQSAKSHGIASESSYRFERGVDPQAALRALDRVTEYILAWSGAERVGAVTDRNLVSGEALGLRLRPKRVEQVTGLTLKPGYMLDLLRPLEIEGEIGTDGALELRVPSFRQDIGREIDLIEEVARLEGYDRIPELRPGLRLALATELGPQEQLRDQLVAWGFCETLHYGFDDPEWLRHFAQPGPGLRNPLSAELSALRSTLAPQLLKTAAQNSARGSRDQRLFELGTVFAHDSERPYLGLCLSGRRHSQHFQDAEAELDFLDLKGFVEELTQTSAAYPEFRLGERAWLHPKRQAELYLESRFAGYLGELHPQSAEAWGLKNAWIAELDVEVLLTVPKKALKLKLLSSFPKVERDINLIVDEALRQEALAACIAREGGDWLQEFYLLDLYRGVPIASGKKALTYRLLYQALDRSLTDAEVNAAREHLLRSLKAELGAVLRD